MNPCPCPCHEFTPESQGCFNCVPIHTLWAKPNPKPKPKPKLTAQNLHAVVSYIESTPDPAYNATRYTLHFVPPPATYISEDSPPSPPFTNYTVLVANEALSYGNLTAKDILASHINNDLHFGKLPAYLFDLLKEAAPAHDGVVQVFANEPFHSPPSPNGQEVVETLRSYIPGVDTMVKCPANLLPAACPDCIVARVECPHGYSAVACVREYPIYGMVQHLNDSQHRWSREQIADWLEALDVDLSFQDEPVQPPPAAAPSFDKLIQGIYAPHIQQQIADADAWAKLFQQHTVQKAPPLVVVHPNTYAEIKKHADWYSSYVEFKIANSLKGEWLDEAPTKVDTHPLAVKAKKHAKPPSYGKFLHNPTKSKKTKEH